MSVDTNYQADKVCDYELLTRFNPTYIQEKIALIENDIESMYDRTYPHLVGDTVMDSIYYESFSLEHLALDIIDQKERLAKYKQKSKYYLKCFYTVLEHYTPQERHIIKSSIRKHHIPDTALLECFKHELYEFIEHMRGQYSQSKVYEYKSKDGQRSNTYAHRLTLNQEKALRLYRTYKDERESDIECFYEHVIHLDTDSLERFVYSRNEYNISLINIYVLIDIANAHLSEDVKESCFKYLNKLTKQINRYPIEERITKLWNKNNMMN
ncbi:hypothetical protein [Staphylococcus warneri]|uniref:hypothetical protein n=1 Tax=Staphylococcus warneri TaxID=1292 RepID=UPI0011A59B9D|nr:hypothetical protein [Staphylococcus warneri]